MELKEAGPPVGVGSGAHWSEHESRDPLSINAHESLGAYGNRKCGSSWWGLRFRSSEALALTPEKT